jgi:mono/diheme cytochrome c family protein
MPRMHIGLAAVLALATTGAAAQDIGQPGRGLALAKRLCAECHAVEKSDDAQSPNPDAPHFQLIAMVPGMNALALTAALNTSHRSMPNVMLDATEQADLIAYILTLK